MTTANDSTAYRTVGQSSEVPEGYVMPYYVDDQKARVAVTRVEGVLYAFDDLCSHARCPLSSGLLTGTTVMCQCHGSQFDVTSGEVLRGPATSPLKTYAVQETDGAIELGI